MALPEKVSAKWSDKFQIINITLNHEDDPQLIFECLNSTGLALSEGDKIHNYILMGLSLHEQEAYYTKYWNEIEKNTGYDVSSFVRDYLSIKQQMIPNLKSVYPSFKSFRLEAERNGRTTEDILNGMLAYAKGYRRLTQPDVVSASSTELDWCIYRLDRLKTTVTRSFFLEILRLGDAGTLSQADILKIFCQTEVYLFRRTICDLPTNALNKIFLFLHRDIINLDGTSENYCENQHRRTGKDLILEEHGNRKKKQRFFFFADCVKGFRSLCAKRHGLHINRWIKNQVKWTEAELEQRDTILQGEAVTLWPRPETSYCPPVRQKEFRTLWYLLYLLSDPVSFALGYTSSMPSPITLLC